MDYENKKQDNPLYLPPGSIRSVLALLLCVAFIYVVISGGNVKDIKEVFLMAVAFYFGSKMKS